MLVVWQVGLLAACWVSAPAVAAKPETERTQLLKEQASLQARFDSELAACRQRFVVTSCVEAAQQAQRASLASLRERLIQLDEAPRQQRALERLQGLQAKQRLRKQRADDSVSDEGVSTPRPKRRLLPPAVPEQPAVQPGLTNPGVAESAVPARDAAASLRVSEVQRRKDQAEQRQQRVARRQVERESRPHKPTSLLPDSGGSRSVDR